MSYPSPYQPPTPQYSQYNYYQPDVLGPARRASVLMFVTGGLLIASSLCCGVFAAMLPQLMQQPEFSAQMRTVPGVTQEQMQLGAMIGGGLAVVGGLVVIVLGVFVRRGSKGAAITSMVLAVLALLYLVGTTITSMAMGRISLSGANALGVCFLVLPMALLALLIVWLIGAMRSADHVTAARYAQQYWQYAQQQQAYGQQQYPYPYPPAQAGGPGIPPPQQQQQQPPPPPSEPGDPNGPSAQG